MRYLASFFIFAFFVCTSASGTLFADQDAENDHVETVNAADDAYYGNVRADDYIEAEETDEFQSSDYSNYSYDSSNFDNYEPIGHGISACSAYQPCVRLEAAPAYLHIDILENSNTVKTESLYGGRLDAAFPVPFLPCIFLKPVLLGAFGQDDSRIWSATLNVGFLYDYNDCFTFAPVVGFSFTEFRTEVNYPQFNAIDIKEKFYSTTVLLGGDVIYRFWPSWRFVGSFYYGFSKARTIYKDLFTVRSQTSGPSYYGMIERDLNDCYSINVGGGYNGSFSEDKDGIRAWGVKIGLVRWL